MCLDIYSIGGNRMNEDRDKVFRDFKLSEKVSQAVIDKYRGFVGNDVVEIWEQYGFGSTLNGYLKIINPDDMQQLLEETYIMPFDDIPVFVTGMGDIITCNSRGSFTIADYRHQRTLVLWADKKIAWTFFNDSFCKEEYLQCSPYFEAVEKYGEPEFDECFGYVPLLSLGGNEDVDNLEKVNYKSHISLIGDIQGVLSY